MTIIVGSNASETLNGGTDADVINALGGNDVINAGSRPSVPNSGIDVVDGGNGIDTLVVDASAELQSVSFSVGISPSFTVRSTSGNFYVDAYKMERFQFIGGAGDDNINSGEFGGAINGGGGINYWTADLSGVFKAITFNLGITTAIPVAGLTSIFAIDRINLTTSLGNDAIAGGNQGDTIFTGDGNDTVNAESRQTTAGAAIDVVDGGADVDTLVVDASSETTAVQLFVGSTPTFQVRSASNRFYVDAYNMEVINFRGGSGGDTINAGDHAGSIIGGAGVDRWLADLSYITANIAFTLGTTTSIAAAGLTTISTIEAISLATGIGNDAIVGGGQADSITTGSGNDTIDAKTRPSAAGSDIDVVDGGKGIDTLIVNAAAENKAVQLFAGGSPTFSLRSTSGNFYADAYNIERIGFTGGAGADDIRTADHGGSVDGGAGLDSWFADLSAQRVDLTFILGSTTSINSAGLNSIANIDRIELTTGSGDDTVTGGAQADAINTNAGNDVIDAKTRPAASGSGIDVVDGGVGKDTLVVDAGAETKSVQLFVGSSPTFSVRSNSGIFYVDAYNMELVDFTGGAGADDIRTADHAGSVDGGAGMDSWFADLSGVTADIFFSLGATTAIASAGLTSILGLERVELTTGSGNDDIIGGAQADAISTSGGNDFIDAKTRPTAAGSGIDVVDGGQGIDTLIVDASAETKAVQLFAGGSPAFSVRSESGRFFIDAYSVERVNLTSGAGADAITGRFLDDTIATAIGNDTIDGGDGNDSVNAGAGVDTLYGSRGIDQLTGGAGADDFIYSKLADSGVANNSVDFIIDFQAGIDDLDVSALDANNSNMDGNQAFTFIGAAGFHNVKGELRAIAGTVEADINGDAIADFRVNISNGASLGANDIVL